MKITWSQPRNILYIPFLAFSMCEACTRSVCVNFTPTNDGISFPMKSKKLPMSTVKCILFKCYDIFYIYANRNI